MERIEEAIQEYYESTDELEQAETRFMSRLMKFKKDDLAQFIIDMQNRGCFEGICYKR
jgi:hypothetical protein